VGAKICRGKQLWDKLFLEVIKSKEGTRFMEKEFLGAMGS